MTAIKKVFVSVGADPQPFDRLLKEVDRLAEKKVLSNVFCQTGYSAYRPKNAESKDFLGPLEFRQKIKDADLVILHGGAGAIGIAMQFKKKAVVMPRLFKFGEHVNDHQIELVEHMQKHGFVLAAWNETELEKQVLAAQNWQPKGFDGGKRMLELLNEFANTHYK